MPEPSNARCIEGPAANKPPITSSDMVILAILSAGGMLIVLLSSIHAWV